MNIYLEKIASIIKSDLKYLYLKSLPGYKYNDFLKKEYKQRTGKKLELESPKTYTEKMQYAKLNLNSSTKTKLSDKYLVREWVKNKIGEKYLIPLLGVWETFSDIEFDKFPNEFVLKLNTGSGANIVVKNKDEFNSKLAKLKFSRWLKINLAYFGDIQPHYADIHPKIIAENYIQDSKGQLNDYKFLCFNGVPYFCWLDIDDSNGHFRNIYDMKWVLQPWRYNKFANTPYKVPMPDNYDEMIKIAKVLSQGFSHVRVDLYNVDGKIYFGEMTFTSSGGYSLIYPEEYNYMLGDLWNIKKS